MPTATAARPARKTRAARKAAATPATQQKADADALLDSLVEGTPQQVLTFLEELAAERARAQQFGLFKLWSIGNRCMVAGQVRRRRATVRNLFAGPKQWEAISRTVRPEEVDKPYYIQGSPFYTVQGDPDPQTGEPTEELRPGRASQIKVYDWSQTVSTDEDYAEPDWEVPVAAGDLTTLRQLATSAPLPVRFANLAATGSHAAYTAEAITLDETIPVGNQIFALATAIAHHQLGHPLDVTAPPSSSRRRTLAAKLDEIAVARAEATLVGWMVARALGLDQDTDGAVTELAANYLHDWTRTNADGTTMELPGRKSRRKALRGRMDTVIKAADAILSAYTRAGQNADAA